MKRDQLGRKKRPLGGTPTGPYSWKTGQKSSEIEVKGSSSRITGSNTATIPSETSLKPSSSIARCWASSPIWMRHIMWAFGWEIRKLG